MFTLMSSGVYIVAVGCDSSSLLLSDINPVICLLSPTPAETLATVIISFRGPYKAQQSSSRQHLRLLPCFYENEKPEFQLY